MMHNPYYIPGFQQAYRDGSDPVRQHALACAWEEGWLTRHRSESSPRRPIPRSRVWPVVIRSLLEFAVMTLIVWLLTRGHR